MSQEHIAQFEAEFQIIMNLKFMEWELIDEETFPWTCYASKVVPGIELSVHEDASFEILFFQKIRDLDEILNHIVSLPGGEEFLFHMDIIQKRTRILDGTNNW